WCNATWDTVLCWPSVPAGNTVYLPCPPLPGLDATQKGFRKCGLDGRWEGGRQPIGYTNYTFCYTPESRKLFQKFFVNKTEEERQMMNDIIVGTRTMEIIGLWISLVTSLVSLFIFSYFRCWFPYYLEPYHWIVEAPRVAIMAVNLMFLLNIIRVLIKKLRKSHTQEPQVTKVRKAVKAAIVLLPLLGITNFVVMTEPPESVVNFGIWSYSTHFLVSFQGFFISLLYCYLNGEVQMVLRKTWNKFRQTQMIKYSDSNFRRYSRSLSIFTSVTEVPNNNGYQAAPVISNLNAKIQNGFVDGDTLKRGPIIMDDYNGTCTTTVAQLKEICSDFCPCDEAAGLECYRDVIEDGFIAPMCREKDFVNQKTKDFIECYSDPNCKLPIY
ncbi:hypothetical protein FSP39_020735, partial [Pinctada imbricata]